MVVVNMRKGLPKKYAKMGFAKGWKAYKASKRAKPKTKAKSRPKSGGKKMPKKKTVRRKAAKLTFGNIKKVLIGAGIAAAYEVVVSPMIPGSTIKNVIELFVGLFLAAMPGIPMPVKAFGAALATINAYSLIVPYVQQLVGEGGLSDMSW